MALSNLWNTMDFYWDRSPTTFRIAGPTDFEFAGDWYTDDDWTEGEWVDYMRDLAGSNYSDIETSQHYNWGTIDNDTSQEGRQTTFWKGMFGGVPYMAGALYHYADASDIARYVAQEGFDLEAGDEVNWFQQAFMDDYNFHEWEGDSTYGYQAQIEQNQDLYALQEANMWDSYFTWEEGQLGLLETEIEAMDTQISDAYADVEEDREEALQKAIEKKYLSEEQKSAELIKARREAGRTGFGTGKKFDRLMDKMTNELSGLNIATYQVNQVAEEAEEGVTSEYGFNVESLMQNYITAQQSKLMEMGQNVETWHDSFINANKGIYGLGSANSSYYSRYYLR